MAVFKQKRLKPNAPLIPPRRGISHPEHLRHPETMYRWMIWMLTQRDGVCHVEIGGNGTDFPSKVAISGNGGSLSHVGWNGLSFSVENLDDIETQKW